MGAVVLLKQLKTVKNRTKKKGKTVKKWSESEMEAELTIINMASLTNIF